MQTRIAVFIDAENMPASMATDVFSRVKELGTPVVKRVFGNSSALLDWAEAISTHQCKKFLQTKVSATKNATDMALAINAMDLLHRDTADAFCIVSNDRDFIPLAKRLRAAQKPVHAVYRRDDGRLAKVYSSVFEVERPSRTDLIVAAFRKIVSAEKHEFWLSEAAALLREIAPDAFPPPGSGRFRKVLEATNEFIFSGAGASTRVRLKSV
jgi:uncharacterized LabA/DUF88 family protein